MKRTTVELIMAVISSEWQKTVRTKWPNNSKFGPKMATFISINRASFFWTIQILKLKCPDFRCPVFGAPLGPVESSSNAGM
jgi:hypothetical protein